MVAGARWANKLANDQWLLELDGPELESDQWSLELDGPSSWQVISGHWLSFSKAGQASQIYLQNKKCIRERDLDATELESNRWLLVLDGPTSWQVISGRWLSFSKAGQDSQIYLQN